MDSEVTAVSETDWADLESIFMADASARNCWCQFHVLENSAARETTRQSRKLLMRDQISTLDPPRGLLAWSNEGAEGWCGVEPRIRLRHVVASRLVKASSPYPADDARVWAIYCILIPPAKRRTGIGTRLLSAAIEHARRGGATAIEGYPIDTSRRDGVLQPGFSTGTLVMFEAAGFSPTGSLPSGRTLVHIEL